MNNDKLPLQSTDITAMNIEKIAALFPNCVTETAEGKKVDFDMLKQELSTELVDGNKERYRLEWPGKREAIVTANIPTNKTLRPVREDSVDFDNTENIYIEGDNLEVLKLLQESYLNKIKMIYIDPPYNTGRDFVYKDNFAKSGEEELLESGQKDEYGQRLQANPETGGRYHSDWLSMMYPRLKLARNLLTEDGVIFISIDDNEVHNLRKICDEIFGEGNFVANIVWQSRTSISNDYEVSLNHNHSLIYSKIRTSLKFGGDKLNADEYTNPDNDSRGPWKLVPIDANHVGGATYYPIKNPKTGVEYFPPNGRIWAYNIDGFNKLFMDGRIKFGMNDDSAPKKKLYLNERIEKGDKKTPSSILLNAGSTKNGTADIMRLFNNKKLFDYPKPVSLLERFLQYGFIRNNDIILDFFSGSATTAHAVMQLNSEDQGKRKYIMVQLPEATDEKSEAYKAGYKNICEIGKERIRRAAKSITNEQITNYESKKTALEKLIEAELIISNDKIAFPEGIIIDEKAESLLAEIRNSKFVIDNLDTGFRVYRLDTSNMQDVYYRPQDYNQAQLDIFADNVKEDRSAEDLVAQIMLDWGLELSLSIERKNISGKEVFAVAGDSLYCCFDKNIDEAFAKEIAKEQPLRIVFRDKGFKDDTAKENVKQLLKQLAPQSEMKVV